MRQVVVVGGEIRVVDAPAPALSAGSVRVRTRRSLISAGTESASVASGGGSLFTRALRNPRLARKVIDRIVSHGLRDTVNLVRGRLAMDMPTGYSCAGVITEIGAGVERRRIGERVACCGAGYANHAEVNVVPHNLVARIPDNVSFDQAAFGTLGAIALQGVRRCAPTLGERVVVLGLGLLGQITAQLLKASGSIAIGVDLRSDRVARACALGMRDGFNLAERGLAAGVLERTEGRGADAVIVTAAASDPGLLNQAFDACRRKGKVVLVGDVPMRIRRDKIYSKEIDFLISCSYGPGRYDPEYEEKGHDYPLAYVRWTEGRNLEEILRLISVGALDVTALTDLHVTLKEAASAYTRLGAEPRPIGVLLDYPEPAQTDEPPRQTHAPARRVARPAGTDRFGVGVVGYGGYFRSVLLPLLRAHAGFRLQAVCARSGLSVRQAVEKDGFASGTTDYHELLADPAVAVVYVTTRHDLHYPIARDAVLAGKAVFVEKPMTLTIADGRALAALVQERQAILSVGFNRRFSPHVTRLKALLAPIASPKMLVYRVNAGPLPPNHWLLDPEQGGGRLLGEGVHFFDLLSFLAGCEPIAVRAAAPGESFRDEAACVLEFADGSVGALIYSGQGDAAAGKERLEVFAGGATFVLDDYRSLAVHGAAGQGLKSRMAAKGQAEQLESFLKALRGEDASGVTAADGLRATWCAIEAMRAARGTGAEDARTA